MILIVGGLAVVIALSTVSNRLGIAPPLILMLVGVGVSLLPFVSSIRIDPEWILAGVLPGLLYAGAVAIPTVNLRRDFFAIGGLAVLLVVISSVVLGFIIHLVIPEVGLALGIALGAILSPTDAAATTIVRRLGVSSRVGTILQGESLLNDATALVLLRSAIAAIAASVSAWKVIGDFLWAALAAAVIGALVGWVGVRLRGVVHNPAPATAISFLLPFIVYILSELVHASGLVAVVAAGIVAAELGPKYLDARQRLAERSNWQTLEFLLEGTVFLAMGLELYGLVVDLNRDHETLRLAIGVAGLAFVVIVLVRWMYVAVLVHGTSASADRRVERAERWRKARAANGADGNRPPDDSRRARRRQALRERRDEVMERLDQASPAVRARFDNRLKQIRTRIRRYLADVDYLLREPLGFKEASLLTWAGLRGVVTLAAAQTLPLTTPHRSLLVLIAFMVAGGSLVLQGGTLTALVKALGLTGQDAAPEGEWAKLRAELGQAADRVPAPTDQPADQIALAKVHAMRQTLLDLRSAGTYTSKSLATVLAELDAEEISLQLRLSSEG